MSKPHRKRDYGSAVSTKGIKLDVNDWQEVTDKSTSDESVPKLMDDEVLHHLQSFGENVKVRTTDNVYIKLQIPIPESRYLEENFEHLDQTLKEKFGINDIILSETVPGVIERYVTINGKLKCVIRSALFIGFKMVCLNNIYHDKLTLDSSIRLSFYLQDTMDSERHRQVDQKAKFSKLDQYELTTPNYFSPLGNNISIVDIKGSFTSIFDFLCFTIDSSPHKSHYIDDDKILKLPVVFTNDAEIYQTQEINKGLLSNSIKETLEFIYDKSYLDKNQFD